MTPALAALSRLAGPAGGRLWVWPVALAVGALLVLALRGGPRPVGDHGGLALDLFAALLTGEAVVFALSFSASTSWPSLREIDRHTGFRTWVLVGGVGALALAVGDLLGTSRAQLAGVSVLLLADLLGVVSFLRLFRLAGRDGRQDLLRSTLTQSLQRRGEALAGGREDPDDGVERSYLRELDSALAANDSAGVADLTAQLASLPVSDQALAPLVTLHLQVLRRASRAALLGQRVDAVVVARAVEDLTRSLVQTSLDDEQRPRVPAAVGLCHLARTLAWLSECTVRLHTQGDLDLGAARAVVGACVEARAALVRAADPEPSAAATVELGTPFPDRPSATTWLRCVVEHHGTQQAVAMYAYYQTLTGHRFTGNFFDGALLVHDLRARLDAQLAQRDLEDFDRAYVLLSANALALYRPYDAFPAALARQGLTGAPSQLCSDLRMFAGHACVSTAEDARQLLASLCARDGGGRSRLWQRTSALLATVHNPFALPLRDPRERAPALVLAVALRLAPTGTTGDLAQLESFLGGLPPRTLDGVAGLAARTLPEARGTGSPLRDVLRGLELVRAAPSSV